MRRRDQGAEPAPTDRGSTRDANRLATASELSSAGTARIKNGKSTPTMAAVFRSPSTETVATL